MYGSTPRIQEIKCLLEGSKLLLTLSSSRKAVWFSSCLDASFYVPWLPLRKHLVYLDAKISMLHAWQEFRKIDTILIIYFLPSCIFWRFACRFSQYVACFVFFFQLKCFKGKLPPILLLIYYYHHYHYHCLAECYATTTTATAAAAAATTTTTANNKIMVKLS